MKNTLKIAQLHWGFPPIIGGVETHLTILLPELKRRGHKISLLTGSVENEKIHYDYKGVEIFRSPLLDLNWLNKRGLDALDSELIKLYNEFLDKTKPDIVHVHNMHYFSFVHIKTLENLLRARKIPLILTAHNVWDDILYLKLARNIKWDHIIAVSHFIKRELIGAGVDDNKITVIHHGVDTEYFKPNIQTNDILKKFPKLKNKRIVFHPARMGLAKGCDVSIKAINIVKKVFPDVLLVLAGTKNIIDWGDTQQKDIAYFVNLVKIFDLQDNVFIDFFALDDMPKLYNLSQVCIYPSSAHEPFGLTMLEAQSCAKPMIVTENGGMPEIIMNDIDGHIIKPKDFEALASRVIHLLSDENLRKRFGNTGRQKVCTHFTKEIMTDCHERLYYQALQDHHVKLNILKDITSPKEKENGDGLKIIR